MEIKHLLMASAIIAVSATASAFEWNPTIDQPHQSSDITASYQLENLRFHSNVSDATNSNEMPKWIDEDGNEISATTCIYDPLWDATEFTYVFDFSSFKSNGEYTLLFPEGMLVNASGEKSAKKEFYYSVDIPSLSAGMFADFKVLTVSPDFSQPQALWTDQNITLNSNHNDAIGYTSIEIVDKTTSGGIVSTSNYTTPHEMGKDTPISFEVVGTYKFIKDHEYTADFTFYNGYDAYDSNGNPTPIVGRASYTFTGRVEGFRYSEIELVSVSPNPGSLISESSKAIITYEFSGPANVYKALTPLGQYGNEVYDASCLSSNDDKTIWTLDLSKESFLETIDAALPVDIYVKDQEGNQLRGNTGVESGACYSFEWICDLGGKPIVVSSPTAGETLDRLTEITVKSENGESMTWSWMGEAYVKDSDDKILGTIILAEGEETMGTEIHFTKWMDNSLMVAPIDIVAAGSYKIYFGPGCFTFGEQSDAVNSRSVTSEFRISGKNDTSGADTVEADAVTEVYDMQGRIVLRGASAADIKALDKGIYIFNGKKYVVN